MKETLSTIASRTGFSITTISRVLSGKAEKYRICKKTKDAILDEAKSCNYLPSLTAQSLRTNRSNMVGLLVPTVSNPYFAEMAHVVIEELRKTGYTTIVIDTMEDGDILAQSVLTLAARQVDGIIAVPCGTDCSMLEEIEGHNIPVVLLDRFYEGSKLPYVTTNNYNGGLEATRYLLARGHRNIACIKGVETSLPNKERVRGYIDAMKEASAESEIQIVGDEFSVQNGYLRTQQLLRQGKRPSAIFALSNTIAMGAIKAIRESGLRIPDDISLITFDNNIYLDFIEPVMARVSQPVEDMAKLATKILLDRIGSTFRGYSQLRLSPTLLPGGSIKTLGLPICPD